MVFSEVLAKIVRSSLLKFIYNRMWSVFGR